MNRAAAGRRRPKSIATVIVAPDRDTPGTSAAACAQPIQNASASVRLSSVRRLAPTRSASSSPTAPSASIAAAMPGVRSRVSMRPLNARPATTAGIVPTASSQMSRAPSGPGRTSPRSIDTASPAAAPPRPQQLRHRARHRRQIGLKVDGDRDQRADVRRDVECQAELLCIEPERGAREDEMCRARDREELGQPLHDAENGRLHESGHWVGAARRTGCRPGRPGARTRAPCAAASTCASAAAARGGRTGGRRRPRHARDRRAAQHDRERRGDEPAGVGRRERADQHREREALEHLAAEQVQREHRQEDGAGRDDGPRERLVEARVDHRVERIAAAGALVLPDAIEDDDHVVHRVADHRQHRGDDVQRHLVAEEHQERERDEHVVEGRHDRAQREAHAEPERHPRRDAQHREHRRVNALAAAAPRRPRARRSRC